MSTYTISDNGTHTIRIQEYGNFEIDDTVFFEMVTWMQSNGIIGTTNVNTYVIREQEEIFPAP